MRIPSQAVILSLFLGAAALFVPATAAADTASCDGGMADGACDPGVEPCTCDDCDGKIPVCGGCTTDGVCNSDDACTCPECDTDTLCTGGCNFDGICAQFSEGCSCDDCKGVPNCADNGTGGGGGAGTGGNGTGGAGTGGSGTGGSGVGGGGDGGSGGGSDGGGDGGCGCRTAGGDAGSTGLLALAALGAVVGLRRRRRG